MDLFNKEKIEQIDRKLDMIISRLDMLDEKMDEIKIDIDNNVVKKCDKMEKHIDFVDNVYASVKKPLGYLCNSVNSYSVGWFSSKKPLELPDVSLNNVVICDEV